MKHKIKAVLFDLGERELRSASGIISELKSRGTRLGLCSATVDAGSAFDAVAAGRGNEADPRGYIAAAERLDVHPVHCLVFCGTSGGIDAASAAHMKCIGVGDSEALPEALETIRGFDEVDVEALLETGHKQKPPAEPWTIAETEVNPKRAGYWESIFALTNGYMGVRGTYDEDDPIVRPHADPGMFINTVYDIEPYHHIIAWKGLPTRYHAMVNLSDWRIVNLVIDGEWFSLFSGNVSGYRRELDMREGVVRRSLEWESPSGKRVRIASTRLVSMVRRHSAAVRIEVTPLNFDGAVEFESMVKHNPRSNILPGDRIEVTRQGTVGAFQCLVEKTRESGFEVAMAFAHSLQGGSGIETRGSFEEGSMTYLASALAKQGETLTFTKYGGFYSTFEEASERIVPLAVAELERSASAGFDTLYREQTEFWSRYWDKADIEIGGSVPEQQAIRFCLFHLRQSHPEEDRRSISATGMTSDGYFGHVFWDTEMYMVPAFLYSEPEIVRPLLMYRYNLLDRARAHAAEMDGKGALFAWNSINGDECGIVYEAATAEYHINCAVAYAIWRYSQQTGDMEFLYGPGAEMLFETSRFLVDLGKFVPLRDNKFCINVVCGPDEYACGIDNNCYTNMMTQFQFEFAARVYEDMKRECPDRLNALAGRIGLTPDEPELWLKAARDMLIPFNERHGIHEQDDAYINRDPVDMSKVPFYTDIRFSLHPLNLWRVQITKQADVVLLMFTLGDRFTREIKRANYEFYEPRTNHGSSLSPAVHAIVAAEIGREDHMADYFRDSAFMDIFDVKNNTRGGIHAASVGGTWMAMINGIAGMRDYEDKLIFDPKLPQGWDYYRFKINYRGRLIGINVEKGRATYELLSGNALVFFSGETRVELSETTAKVVVER